MKLSTEINDLIKQKHNLIRQLDMLESEIQKKTIEFAVGKKLSKLDLKDFF